MSSLIKRSFGLDLIRAIAIVLVILSHFITNWGYLGFWGVEIFFGLSGFLIGQILWRSFSEVEVWSFKHVKNFWSRRWWRTLPNYYLFFFIMLMFHYLKDGHLPPFPGLLNFLWFGQYLFNHNFGFYSVSWSLCIEEWFYLLFPVILLFFTKMNFKPKISFIATLLLFFIGSAIVRLVLINKGEEHNLREITFARLDSIGYGVLVSYISSIIRLKSIYKLVGFSIGVLCLLSPLLHVLATGKTFEVLKESPIYLIILPLGSSLMLPLISSMSPLRKTMGWFTISIQKLSMWSYSIYLIHLPLMWTTYYLFEGLRGSLYGNIISKAVGLAFTIILSAITYNVFEIPIMRRRPSEINRNKTLLELSKAVKV